MRNKKIKDVVEDLKDLSNEIGRKDKIKVEIRKKDLIKLRKNDLEKNSGEILNLPKEPVKDTSPEVTLDESDKKDLVKKPLEDSFLKSAEALKEALKSDLINDTFSVPNDLKTLDEKELFNQTKRLKELRNFILKNSSKPVAMSTVGHVKNYVSPKYGESFDDYCIRYNQEINSQQYEITKEKAISEISRLSKFLLKEVEEERVCFLSERKSLKTQLLDHFKEKFNFFKNKLSLKKDELFWKFVDLLRKLLKVR